jgi:hypothetical protein
MVSHPKKTVIFRLGTLESTMKHTSWETFEYDTAITSAGIHMSFLKPVHKQGPLLHKASALKTFLVPPRSCTNYLVYSAYRLPQCCQFGYSMNLLKQYYTSRHAIVYKLSESCSLIRVHPFPTFQIYTSPGPLPPCYSKHIYALKQQCNCKNYRKLSTL